MKALKGLSAHAAVLLSVLAVVSPPALAQTAGGPAVAIQFDSLFFFRGPVDPADDPTDWTGGVSQSPFSPFVGLEVRLFRPLSLRVEVGPPMGTRAGQQAFATNVALQAWLGRPPHFLELGIGSYYQNTWRNGVPDYKVYTASLGWRYAAGRLVIRFGYVLGITPGGRFAQGLSLGLGRSI